MISIVDNIFIDNMKIKTVVNLLYVATFLNVAYNAQAETKQLYGIAGPKLVHQKVSDKSYSYEVKGITYTTKSKNKAKEYVKEGLASYYHADFNGRKTSNGEIFDNSKYTAAHKTLPLNSYAVVTNLRNKRKVIVRINDRGPFSGKRIIDLSSQAAKELGLIARGVGQVKVEALHVDAVGKISGSGVETLAKRARDTKNLLLSDAQLAKLTPSNKKLDKKKNKKSVESVKLLAKNSKESKKDILLDEKLAKNSVKAKKVNKTISVAKDEILAKNNKSNKKDATANNPVTKVSLNNKKDNYLSLRVANVSSRKQAEDIIKKLALKNITAEVARNGKGYDVKFASLNSKSELEQLKKKITKLDSKQKVVLYSYNK